MKKKNAVSISFMMPPVTGWFLSGLIDATLQNFAGGILILLPKPFAAGDYIITQGPMVTTFDNRLVIMPNSKLSNEIINISREGNRRLDLNFRFPSGADIKRGGPVINAATDEAGNVPAKPGRRIGIGELQGDGYLKSVNIRVNAHGYQDTKLALRDVILQDIKDAGIKIPGL